MPNAIDKRDNSTRAGGHCKDTESLPQESVKDKVDQMFGKMEDSSVQKVYGIRTASQPSDPILKVAEVILKIQKPNIKPFSGDYVFHASFKQLEDQGYYNENKLLNLLLGRTGNPLSDSYVEDVLEKLPAT